MRRTHDPLAGMDLNLVVALDALLAERHVTRAASRLGVTQSAASHTLARLRELLGDPLLVRGPAGTMLATPRAEQLVAPVRKILGELAQGMQGTPAFDPATSRAVFHLGTSDYAEVVLLPKLVERLGRLAPRTELWVHNFTEFGAEALASGALDLVIGPTHITGKPAASYEKRMFDEGFTCVMRTGHPLARGKLTLARYCEAAHLLVAPRSRPGSVVDSALTAIGQTRRIALALPHFLVVPHVIAGTDLIATLATRVAALFTDALGLVCRPPPLTLPRFNMALTWHERSHQDPAHRWLREQLLAVATEIR
ncbi:MAG: LysR family transcriptional regulator [Kofleriaceae bacterium]